MHKVKKWLLVLACWILVALLFTSEVIARGGSLFQFTTRELLVRNLINCLIWFALTPVILKLASRFRLSQENWATTLTIHAAACCLLATLHVAIFTFVLQQTHLLLLQDSYLKRFQNLLSYNFHSNVALYVIVVAAAFVIRNILRSHREPVMNSNDVSRADMAEPSLLSGLEEPNLQDRIPIKSNGRITFVEPTEIDWLEAYDNYVKIHVGLRSHLIRDTIARFETRLEPMGFLRVHRSIIVNTKRIKELRPLPGSVFEIVLEGEKVLRSGRSFRSRFSSMLGE